MRVLVVLLALMGTAFAVPAVPMMGNRIVGGEVTTIDKYPYMANMRFLTFGVWWWQTCGGSLLTNNVVLSAAHCYQHHIPMQWRVLLGTSYRSSGGTEHYVSQLILHERYNNPVLDNDIALIRLERPAVYSNTIQPARIAGPNYILSDGTPVTVLGWGSIRNGGPASEQLQHVEVNLINQELCTERYAYLKTLPGFARWPDISDGMLCAGILDVGGKDACQGDSGGPVAHQNDVVVGITSWGYSCCADDFYPGVNVRVSYYTDWILTNA